MTKTSRAIAAEAERIAIEWNAGRSIAAGAERIENARKKLWEEMVPRIERKQIMRGDDELGKNGSKEWFHGSKLRNTLNSTRILRWFQGGG